MAKSCSYGLGLACFAIAVAMAGATRFQVGGAHGWSVPAAGAESFNAWATKNRFQVGDTLEFVYPSDQDSVLLVDPADYNACNTSSYVKKFTDGDTLVTLDRAGAFFFISGVEANCRANEKVIVMVLAGGRNGTGGAPAPSSSAPPPPPAASPPPPANATPPAASSSPPAPPPPAASPPSSTSAPPPPAAAAPTTTPSTPPPASSSPPPPPKPSAAAPASAPPSAPTGTPQPPPPSSSASSPAPSAQKPGKKSPPPGSKSNDRNGAALTVAAGLASSFGATIVGYVMLAL
ncbi:hypothetical protein ACP70R_029641 [Stipagrostis hirtigluma subsp. patula]